MATRDAETASVGLLVWLCGFRLLLGWLRGIVRAALVNEFFIVIRIVRAYEFLNVPGGTQLEVSITRPSRRIRFGVVDRNVNFQGVRPRAPNAFDYVQLVRMWKTSAIDPGLVVETDGVDDERVSLVSPNGVPHPSKIWILRVLAPIGEDLAHIVIELEQLNHPPRGLDDLE